MATRGLVEGCPGALGGGLLLVPLVRSRFVLEEGHGGLAVVGWEIEPVKVRTVFLLFVNVAPQLGLVLLRLEMLGWTHVSERSCEVLALVHPADDSPVARGRRGDREIDFASAHGKNTIYFTGSWARPLVAMVGP